MAEKSAAEELRHKLERARRGDDEALAELLLAYLPLLRKQAGLLAGRDNHLKDDLVQEGLLALCRAVELYDPRRGTFGAFLKVCVRHAMISLLRRQPKEEVAEASLFEGMSDDDPGPGELLEKREQLKEIVHYLSDTELLAIDAFLETGGVERAARALQWPRKRVDNALTRARLKLRRLILEGD
jgi:RNA polymerase sporulation-specific sigma factor